MNPGRSVLTEEDVFALVRGESEFERAAAAHKICVRIESRPLTPDERRAAQDILRLMASDAAEAVRRAMAVTLKASPLLPREIALKLARDVETVAVPVLNYSPAFTDADLAELVRGGSGVKQVAVAYRPALGAAAADALAEYGVEEALKIACANDNAAFSETALQRVVERFPSSEGVQLAVAYRESLPITVAERLARLVSEAVHDHLVRHHGVGQSTASALTDEALDQVTVDLADDAGRTEDVAAFAEHLHRSGRLTPSLLLRALAQGHMSFFEHAVAELAGVPHHRTWMMIHDAGPLGLRAIYERAGLPARLFPAFRAGVDTYKSVEQEGVPHDQDRFRERVIQRFLTQHQGASREDLEYLLDRLDAATAPAPAAKPAHGEASRANAA
jgi:uncharacterized protein (DUF2336 family)